MREGKCALVGPKDSHVCGQLLVEEGFVDDLSISHGREVTRGPLERRCRVEEPRVDELYRRDQMETAEHTKE